jgi:anti-sigma B factor antagonist
VPAADLSLRTERREGFSVVHVDGELDLSTLTAFDDELGHGVAAGHLLLVDLAGCTFIDSSALRALVRARKQARAAGGELAVAAPSQTARRVLEIAAIDRFVPVFDTVDAAVTSLA